MTLLQLCEPLFQYVCRLNRSARRGMGFDLTQVRQEIKALFADMQSRAAAQPGLAEQYEKVRLPLIYFVDFLIKESELDFARDWQELAHEENMYAGDEHFFDLLDETLADQSQNATQRLAVFYTCIGLGFTGFYTGQPEYLRRKMMEISARLRPMMETDEGARLCPEAYEHVDTSDLVQPPGRGLTAVGIAVAGLAAVLIAGNFYLYMSSSRQLRDSLQTVVTQTHADEPAEES